MAKRETILVDKDAYFYLRQESRKQRGGGVITPDQENSIWNRLCKIDGKRQVCGNSFGGGDGTVDGKWWSWSLDDIKNLLTQGGFSYTEGPMQEYFV